MADDRELETGAPEHELAADARHTARMACGTRIPLRATGVALAFCASVMSGGCSLSDDGAQRETGRFAEERPCAPYADPWPDFVAGVPKDGPVLVAIGRMPPDGLPTTSTSDGHLSAKMLLIVDAEPGTPIRIAAVPATGGHVRFTHATGREPLWATASAEPMFALPGGSRGERPVDVPGVVLADRADDYRIIVRVADAAFGPFCVRLART